VKWKPETALLKRRRWNYPTVVILLRKAWKNHPVEEQKPPPVAELSMNRFPASLDGWLRNPAGLLEYLRNSPFPIVAALGRPGGGLAA